MSESELTGYALRIANALPLTFPWPSETTLLQIKAIVSEAVTDAEERATRAERLLRDERQLSDLQNRTLVVMAKQIAALTPLADEGRKHLTRRFTALELIPSGEYQRLTREMDYELKGAWLDGDIEGSVSDAPYWYTLTDKGRERLAYLRGLLGEEGQSNDDTTT